jgi:hypothetical protein
MIKRRKRRLRNQPHGNHLIRTVYRAVRKYFGCPVSPQLMTQSMLYSTSYKEHA